MDVLLATVGSSGDVHPFVGLGIELRRRGHRVTLITNRYFESLATAAGLEFVDPRPDFDFQAVLRDPLLWRPVRGFRRVMSLAVVPAIRDLYQVIADRYRPGETVVVASSLAFGARIAQEKLGLPLATVHLQPSVFRSDFAPPKLPYVVRQPWVPAAVRRFQYWVADRVIVDPVLCPPINAFRAELGLPPISRVMKDWWNSPQRVLGFFPEWFAPPPVDWPPQLVLTGFPRYDESGIVEPTAEIERFVTEAEPPIAFTPGSANVHGQKFFAAAAEACQILGRRGILLTRFPEQVPRDLPENVRHFDFVPFGWLLPRVAAAVHHGGIGSTAAGLAAGIPQLIMAMSFDQFDNADRVERLGVGRAIRGRNFTGPHVAKLLKQLIDSDQIRDNCHSVAQRFIGERPVEAACIAIEQLLESQPHLAKRHH